ncbi:MAG: hypothetical protein WDN06_19485 [Asticcacaulis sp.]
MQKRRFVDATVLYRDLPEAQPEAWLLRTLANDITALAKLCAKA